MNKRRKNKEVRIKEGRGRRGKRKEEEEKFWRMGCGKLEIRIGVREAE